MEPLTVLKLGGSLITDKKQPYQARPEVLGSVATEIKQCLDEGFIKSLVLIQGVGSYGHPPVMQHKLYAGFKGPHQLMPLSETQSKVNELRTMVMQSLQKAGVPICLLHPSSMAVSEKSKISRLFLEPLKGFLSMGMVPLLGGDLLVDSAMGISVGSGDQLAVRLVRELNASRLIFACDVCGIYDSDPKVNPRAKLIREVDLKRADEILASLAKSESSDASGSMRGKLSAISTIGDLVKGGLQVHLTGMMKPGNLRNVLTGKAGESTKIVMR